jgi:GLPGLI family protein
MKFIIPLLFFLVSSFCFGQNSGTIYYKKTINDGESPIHDVNYKIVFSNQKSLELSIKKTGLKSDDQFVKESDNVFKKQMVVSNTGNQIPFLFKNYETNQLLYTDNISIRYYYLTDTLENFKWSITKEKEKILNYNCTKAITTFRGRSYLAWFTEEIPIRFGPWKFGGLPGLIIKLEDEEKKYVYELTGLDLTPLSVDNEAKIPEQYLTQTPQPYNVFREILANKISDLQKQSNVVTINGNSTSRSSHKLPQKMEKY